MKGFGDVSFSFIEYVKEHIDKINMRFESFEKDKAERRFWSVEVVESMVAFKINRAASILKSEPIFNIGSTFSARDFRFDDANALMPVEQIFNKKNPKNEITLKQLENVLTNIKVNHPDISKRLKDILD